VETVQRHILAEQDTAQAAQQPVRAITAASIAKTAWSPPAHLIEPLKMIWGNYTFEKKHNNWIFQQIYANKGYMSLSFPRNTSLDFRI